MPSPVTMLITPGGRPAASSSRIMKCAANCWVGDGFQTTVLPISAGRGGQVAGDRGEVERRDRVDEALERAVVDPVPDARRATPAARPGSAAAKCTLKRQKSISSQAASISAWCAVLVWPSIVAALSVCRHGPASRSAALRKTAARSSKDSSRQAGAASFAARDGVLRVGVRGVRRRAEDGGVPVRLDDVEALAGGHPLLAADRHGSARRARRPARRAGPRRAARSAEPGA